MREKTMVNILLVEDDEDLNRVVCRHLEMHGYHAAGCVNPAEAYDMLYAKKFDLIISDIMMPGIDGFELARTIRQENDSIPILFMTAREDFSAKEQGYKIGIDDYMVNPSTWTSSCFAFPRCCAGRISRQRKSSLSEALL